MEKKTIKIDFLDFGPDFDKENNFLIRLLQQKYNPVITPKADYAFYTLGGQTHHDFNGIRIFWTGENVIPNFNCCDYAIGFHHITFEDRYHRYPLWLTYQNALQKAMHKGEHHSDKVLLNRGFCATVISNAKQTDGMRERIFDTLSAYKPVASGGKWRNNVGGRVADKLVFQRQYKFTLTCENTYAPGYTTEKILEAFASDTVPIYYGDPRVVEDFNPEAFINVHRFKSLDDLCHYVQKANTNDDLYLKMIRAPIFKNGVLPKHLTEKALLDFLSGIFEVPVSEARRRFYAKPYQDIDLNNMKIRDIKAVFKTFARKGWCKLFRS